MADDRLALATELLDLAAAIARADEIKDALRACADADGAGFVIDVAAKGTVKIGTTSESRLKGIMPELVAESFLALSPRRQETLIRDGLVVMTEQWTQGRKGSVTVKVKA